MRIALLLETVSVRSLSLLYFFLSPLFLSRMSVTADTIILLVSYLILGTLLLLAFAEKLHSLSDRFHIDRHVRPFVLMVLVCLVAVLINSPERLVNPGAYYYKYGKLILPALAFLVMIKTLSIQDVPRLYSLTLALLLISFVGVIVEAFLPSMHIGTGGPYRFGDLLFDDPNKYALFLNLAFAMIMANGLERYRSGKTVRLQILLAALIALSLVSTQSRSGLLTFVVVTGLGLWAARSRKLLVYSVILGIPLVAAILLVGWLRYSGSSNAVVSDLSRIWTYLVAWNIIQDRPLLGVGFANVVMSYDTYGGIYYYLLGRPLGIHNAMLEVFAEQGVLGFMTYMIMVFGPAIVLLRRVGRVSKSGGFAAAELAAASLPLIFFCYGLFYINYLADDYFWAYMAFTIIVLKAPSQEGNLEARLPRAV